MKKIKVTQVRSIIGRNETQKRTIQALGLGKINRSRIHNNFPSVLGMIDKVRHLVMVEDVIEEPSIIKDKKEDKEIQDQELATEENDGTE